MVRLLGGGLACVIVAALAGGPGAAGPSQKGSDPKQPENLAQLSKALKPLLADALPTVLYEKHDNWGHQEMATHAIYWRGLRPERRREMRNDGVWKHIEITTFNPKQTADIRLYGLKSVSDEKQTFKADLAFGCRVVYDQQNWESGIRLWSGSVRARLRVKAHLDCEYLMRTEAKPGSFLPDIVFRLRVANAQVGYDDLVVEHIAGIGGTAAKVIGDTFHDAMNRWKPSIERDLIAKANAAIVKAADTKEVRIGLSALFKEKK